jgi:hypothetical protein
MDGRTGVPYRVTRKVEQSCLPVTMHEYHFRMDGRTVPARGVMEGILVPARRVMDGGSKIWGSGKQQPSRHYGLLLLPVLKTQKANKVVVVETLFFILSA